MTGSREEVKAAVNPTNRTASLARTAAPPATARTATAEQLATPKQERAQLTRARILTAAAEIFAEQGYARSSLADVAKRVGMTKGAVYFHFKDKDDLAIAIVETFYSRWPVVLQEVHSLNLDAVSAVTELLDRTAVAFRTDVMVQAAVRLQSERSLIDASLPRPYQDWIDRVAVLLADGQKKGEVRDGLSADALANVVIASFFGMQHISDVLHNRRDLEQRWAETRTVVLEALRPR